MVQNQNLNPGLWKFVPLPLTISVSYRKYKRQVGPKDPLTLTHAPILLYPKYTSQAGPTDPPNPNPHTPFFFVDAFNLLTLN